MQLRATSHLVILQGFQLICLPSSSRHRRKRPYSDRAKQSVDMQLCSGPSSGVGDDQGLVGKAFNLPPTLHADYELDETAAWPDTGNAFIDHAGQQVNFHASQQSAPLISELRLKTLIQVVDQINLRLSTPLNSGVHFDFSQQFAHGKSHLAMQDDQGLQQFVNSVLNNKFSGSSSASSTQQLAHGIANLAMKDDQGFQFINLPPGSCSSCPNPLHVDAGLRPHHFKFSQHDEDATVPLIQGQGFQGQIRLRRWL